MLKRRMSLALVIAPAVLLGVACGGSGGGSEASPDTVAPSTAAPARQAQAPANDLDPCALVTKAEASGALGAAVADGVVERAETSARCTFQAQDGSKKLVEVVLEQRSSAASADFQRRKDNAVQYGTGTEVVSGIADGALWEGGLAKLTVLKGDTIFGVLFQSGNVLDFDANLAAARSLVTLALPRVEG